MSRLFIGVAFLVSLLVATASAQASKRSDEVAKPENGTAGVEQLNSTAAPRPSDENSVKELDAAAIKTLIGRDGRRARPLLLFLWYTACEPCRTRLPDVERIYEEDHATGLDVVIVSINPIDTKESLSGYLTKHRIRVPAYILQKLDDELAEDIFRRDWEATVPAAFFYNSDGKLLFAKTDLQDSYYEALRNYADRTLTPPHK